MTTELNLTASPVNSLVPVFKRLRKECKWLIKQLLQPLRDQKMHHFLHLYVCNLYFTSALRCSTCPFNLVHDVETKSPPKKGMLTIAYVP